MLIHLKTFDGETLNSNDIRTYLLNQHQSTTAKPVYLEQANADALSAGLYTVDVQRKYLLVQIRNYADRYFLLQTIKQIFKRGRQGDLVAFFADEAVDYQQRCRVISMVADAEQPLAYIVTLETSETAWRGVAAETESAWTVTGTEETYDLDVAGFEETYLSAAMTAVNGPASGYLKQNIYRLPNQPGITRGVIAWCITVNTAALVTAGTMRSDCNDLRIVNLNTGQELRRWIVNPNNAATKVWIVLDLKQGVALTSSAAVAGSGTPAYLQFTINDTQKKKIAAMDKSGIIYHGNEWFYYTNTDGVNCRLTIGKRGIFGTTIEAHNSGSEFRYIQYPLAMKYGNSAASDPALDDSGYDDTKPLINLTSSDNENWYWTSSDKFYDAEKPNRPCGWKFSRTATGTESKVFHIKQDAASGDPAIGFKAASYKVGATWKSDTVKLAASFMGGARITEVSSTGDKYRSNSTWLTYAGLRRLSSSGARTSLFNEATPGSAGSYSAWTRNSVAVADGSYGLEFAFEGGYAAAADAYAVFEALTCTAKFNSSDIQSGAFLGATDNLPLELTIANDENGDGVDLKYPMILGKIFALDGEERTATYDGVNAHSAMALNDESRSALIRLSGGRVNTIRVSGADLGELSVVLSYYRRRL